MLKHSGRILNSNAERIDGTNGSRKGRGTDLTKLDDRRALRFDGKSAHHRLGMVSSTGCRQQALVLE